MLFYFPGNKFEVIFLLTNYTPVCYPSNMIEQPQTTTDISNVDELLADLDVLALKHQVYKVKLYTTDFEHTFELATGEASPTTFIERQLTVVTRGHGNTSRTKIRKPAPYPTSAALVAVQSEAQEAHDKKWSQYYKQRRKQMSQEQKQTIAERQRQYQRQYRQKQRAAEKQRQEDLNQRQ